MKALIYILSLMLAATLMWQCNSSRPEYDAALCRSLSVAIEQHDSITPSMYSRMIDQNEAILRYLTDRTRHIASLPDSVRYSAYRSMVAEPEYLERFGYLFTLGSALYQAQLDNRLNRRNRKKYEALDQYNEELASWSDNI